MIDKIQVNIVTVFFCLFRIVLGFCFLFFFWDSFLSVSKSPPAVGSLS